MLSAREDDAPHMYAFLSLLSKLLDTVIPPAGGTKAEVDAAFADLVARYELP